MSLSLTVLGCAGSHTGVGRACSGYLVQAGGTSIQIDAGNGSTANLQRLVPLRELDAIVVSHRHVDHCIDLIGCYYNLRFDPHFTPPMPLYAAAEVHETLTSLLSADSTLEFDRVYQHKQVDPGDEVTIGSLDLRFAHSVHPVPTVSTRIEVDGHTLVYSGDSAGGDDLVEIARGADLFLCEATWAGEGTGQPEGIHLTGAQAAEVAREAGVGQLVLTHIAGGTDRDAVYREAAAVFDGPLQLAEDLHTYVVE
ncbi:MAG: MBL fold metallo-hydrolase [Nitriliruptoraceae bacterium]